ncbi:MAG TPA: response regulator [Vicinamibacteria bacterium]|nr:response regulator [Vicinamibacteria bacterium]
MPSQSAAAATVLVVDDNELNRDMLGRRLEKRGYRVRTAADGASALDLLAAEPIDLVLLDIEMPGLSGLDVLREVRKTRTSLQLPILMATARSDSQDVVQALEAGANDYIIKPLDFPVVLARVEAQLRLRPPSAPAAGAPADAETGPGTLLAGKYLLGDLIGSGAFGSVYRARHEDLAHDVAVKVLLTAARSSPDALARFQREGIAACRVKHPNAVAVTDFGVTAGGAAFLVMELLEGHSLHDEMKRVGRFTAPRCAGIVTPLCAALAEAHAAGIVHRDIKPGNVFLQRSPRGETVKVLDFGIAKMVDEDARAGNLTVDGGIIGTPAYMAPERFRGDRIDGAADVYSVGVMLYQMLAGRLPFSPPGADLMAVAMMHLHREPPPLREAHPEIAPEIERIVLSALRKDPRERPAIASLAARFAEAAGHDDRAEAHDAERPPAGDVIPEAGAGTDTEVFDRTPTTEWDMAQGEPAAPPATLKGPARPRS